MSWTCDREAEFRRTDRSCCSSFPLYCNRSRSGQRIRSMPLHAFVLLRALVRLLCTVACRSKSPSSCLLFCRASRTSHTNARRHEKSNHIENWNVKRRASGTCAPISARRWLGKVTRTRGRRDEAPGRGPQHTIASSGVQHFSLLRRQNGKVLALALYTGDFHQFS